MALSAVEKELLEATNFDGSKMKTRQLYLAALARAVEKIPANEFDDLTDEAADWYNDAADSISEKADINDFETAEAKAPEDAPAEVSGDDDGTVQTLEAPGADQTESPEAEVQEGVDEEAEPKAPKAKKGPKPKKAKPAKGEPEGKPKHPPRDYTQLTGEKDKWGFIIGTKTSDAAAMYERGTTSKELMDKLGGRFYNLLKDVVKRGHKLEKTPEGLWKITYKDAKK